MDSLVFWHIKFLNLRSITMNGSFNMQILVDKLAKLNNSQHSIETLSYWCIFHRNKAKQVVETWDQQFHCSPRDKRVSFLYLANDILQNSRRTGSEFINEFLKVLPDALTDVLDNGGDFGRKAALRLVDIWEERKVFGSRGQFLKEEILGRKLDNGNKYGNSSNCKLKQCSGELLQKIILSYDHVHDEEALFRKCEGSISIVDKLEKEFCSDDKLGSKNESEVTRELQKQHGILGECIEQLKAAELSRATLVTYLREALHEQETKIEQVRHELQAAKSQYELASSLSAQLHDAQPPAEQRQMESSLAFSDTSSGFIPEATTSSADTAQITPPMGTQEEPLITDSNSSHTEAEQRKIAAAAMAAKLTSSASSAQMLSFVLSSLASESMIGQRDRDDYAPDSKRLKTPNSAPSHVPSPPDSLLQLPMPSFPHPESLQPASAVTHSSLSLEPSPLLPQPSTSLPPTQPPPPPTAIATTQFMQAAAGPMSRVPYNYGSASPPLPSYPMFGMHSNPSPRTAYYSFQGLEAGNRLVQPPFPMVPPPLARQ
ncbi:uncharacterized protein LOC135595307 isoform X1 [Musa acuminata AAA Group]|uniref:uncharacterized protein LOC135595307 isoform X1 n=2 Tax=Musa acuminata AAA Group TaxID=214697 RepID=UPI0031D842B3